MHDATKIRQSKNIERKWKNKKEETGDRNIIIYVHKVTCDLKIEDVRILFLFIFRFSDVKYVRVCAFIQHTQ